MEIGIGGIHQVLFTEVLVYTGSSAETIAAVNSFNFWFSLTMQFGLVAFIFTMVCTIMARS